MEMDQNLPSTIEDTIYNRFYEFVFYGTIQFNHRAATEILISMDKNNAKSCKSAKYIGQFVEASVSGGSFLAGAGPASKVIGNFSGLIVKEIVDTLDKNVQHKTSKKIEKFLEGFDPEDEQWIQFILNCFCEIFIR